MTRRGFLQGGAGAVLACGVSRAWPQEAGAAPLEVASAGALRAMLEGPLKQGALNDLHLALGSHAGGADGVAHSIVAGELMPDVFTPITAEPMRTVLAAGKASVAVPFARTELVLAYSPKSRYVSQFEAASAGTVPWWKVLQQPGLQIARSNPANDPSGRAAVFLLQMAEQRYRQPGLAAAVLGPAENPKQVLAGGGVDLLGRLREGTLDAMVLYRTAAVHAQLPFASLPAEVNLGGDDPHAAFPEVQLVLDGRTFYPEPLVFYAAVLAAAPHPAAGRSFVQWLQGAAAQGLLRDQGFAGPGAAARLQG